MRNCAHCQYPNPADLSYCVDCLLPLGGPRLELAGGRVLALPNGSRLLLGRSDGEERVDVDLQDYWDEGVSRRHACLEREGERLWLSDCGSAHGTWLNERRLEPGQRLPLSPGDRVRLARLTLRYCA